MSASQLQNHEISQKYIFCSLSHFTHSYDLLTSNLISSQTVLGHAQLWIDTKCYYQQQVYVDNKKNTVNPQPYPLKEDPILSRKACSPNISSSDDDDNDDDIAYV